MKIEKITPEQEAKIPIYLKRYFDKVYSYKPIIKEDAKTSIEYIYNNAGYKTPFIWHCDSPLMMQIIGNLFTNKDIRSNLGDNLWDNLWSNLGANLGDNLRDNLWANLWANLGDNLQDNLGDNLWANLGANLWANLRANLRDNLWANLGANLRANLQANLEDNLRDNLRDNLWANLGSNLQANLEDNLRDNLRDNLWANLWDNLGANLEDNLGANLRANLQANLEDNLQDNLKYMLTSYYGNLSDYGWTCFYDFINNELIPSYNLELWNKWKMLINSNVYDMIQLDGLCIVCSMPNIVLIDTSKRIHSENSCSVHFKDGYEIYSWHGIIIPKLWITQKDLITKDVILNEQNAEKRRVLQEILGSEEYCKRLGCVIVDTEIDGRGNLMSLWRSKEKDSACNEFLQFYDCVCPSTNRRYFLCVPETCNNVKEAKSYTFKSKKVEIRHGDVALLNLKKEFNQPIFES